jgi:NADH-quinone oxidoreductase subunit J
VSEIYNALVDNLGFVTFAIILSIGAIQVIRARDLIHGVLWLALSLMTTAAAFASMGAGFLAGIQILLYTGGVVILMLFAVMLTKRLEGAAIAIDSVKWPRGALLAAGMFALLAHAITTSVLPAAGDGSASSAASVGKLFLTRHLAAFEVLSVLLLAAMIGAIVLARKKDA